MADDCPNTASWQTVFPQFSSKKSYGVTQVITLDFIIMKKVFGLFFFGFAVISASADDIEKRRAEKTGKKIRDAEIAKIPYMLIVGEKEANEQQVSVRKHGGLDLGTMGIQQLADILIDETRI